MWFAFSLLLTAIVFPRLSTAVDLQALCPAGDVGKFKCVSDTQFVLCNGLGTVVQNMAAGVICRDNAIHPGKAGGTPPAALPPSPIPSSGSNPALSPSPPSAKATSLKTTPFSPLPILTQFSDTRATAVMVTGALPTLTQTPPSSPTPASTSSYTMPYGGTFTFDTVDCRMFPLKTFGKKSLDDIDQMLYCVGDKDKTKIYTVCNKKGPTPVYKVEEGKTCQRHKDKSCAIV